MRISDVIRRKGAEVVTIKPDDTVRQLLDLLAQHRIGALVVSPDGSTVAGIVSERDVVRHVQSARAPTSSSSPVAQIMTADVTTCGPDDDVEHLMRLMTDQRVRHIPVVVDGALTRHREHRRRRQAPHRRAAVRARPARRLHQPVGVFAYRLVA